MKYLYLFKAIIFTLASVALSGCSTEDAIADAHTGNTDEIVQQRMKTIMAMDFTTLFTYRYAGEAKDKLPGAFDKIITNTRHRLPIEKGASQAVIRIVVEDGKAKLWAEHFMDVPNGRMVKSINKKPDSHIMFMGSRDNYPFLYTQVTETLQEKCSRLGDYSNTATIAAANDYLSNKLGNTNGSAEFHIKVTTGSAEIYSLK